MGKALTEHAGTMFLLKAFISNWDEDLGALPISLMGSWRGYPGARHYNQSPKGSHSTDQEEDQRTIYNLQDIWERILGSFECNWADMEWGILRPTPECHGDSNSLAESVYDSMVCFSGTLIWCWDPSLESVSMPSLGGPSLLSYVQVPRSWWQEPRGCRDSNYVMRKSRRLRLLGNGEGFRRPQWGVRNIKRWWGLLDSFPVV